MLLDKHVKEMSLDEYIEARPEKPVKLHLGCGGERWQDFINVDMNPHVPGKEDSSRSGCVADVFADMRNLGLPDDAFDEIFTVHTIDHFTRWEAIRMFRDWHRMLKPDGLLTV